MKDEVIQDIVKLEQMADKILKMKKEFRQRRPIVIEFCGSPKSGKTSCINSLNLFLKRNGFKTGIVTEQASICPIKDKHNPAFNTWTVNSTISELNALLDPRRNESLDIVICDRAIFDSLCWFKWMLNKGTLEPSEYKTITDYIVLPRWANKIDLVYEFIATPETSIEREYAHLLTRKPGSIMNKSTLSEYISSMESAEKEFESRFRMIQKIDTSKLNQNDVSKEVTLTILKKLEELLIEKIGFIDKGELIKREFDLSTSFIRDSRDYRGLFSLDLIQFDRRDHVRNDYLRMQIIPIGVLTDPTHSKILILKKQSSAAKNSAERGSYLVWFGGHMREEDKTGTVMDFEELAKTTLRREAEEELGISLSLTGLTPYYVYSVSQESSKNHLAICFLIEKEIEGLKLSIDSYELVQNKGTSKSGKFLSLEEICSSKILPTEEWSQMILSALFSVNNAAQSQGGQLSLLDNSINGINN